MKMISVKDIRTNPHSIVQNLLSCNKVKIISIEETNSSKKDSISNSKASQLQPLTHVLKSGHVLDRPIASAGTLRKDPLAPASDSSITTSSSSSNQRIWAKKKCSTHAEFRNIKFRKKDEKATIENRNKPTTIVICKKVTKNSNHAEPLHSLCVFPISSKPSYSSEENIPSERHSAPT